MKTKIITFFLLLSSFTVFAQNKISQKAQDYIDSFMNFRMELSVYQNQKATAVSKIKAYQSSNPYQDFSEQEKLIIDTLFKLEDYHYTRDDKSNDERLQKLLFNQFQKNEAYINANKNNVSSWLYVVTADSVSSYMSYNPVSGAMKYGLKVKKYYENCIELEPKHSYCLSHLAQWYYWAPAINGGSTKKAINYCTNAVTYANNNAEKFFAEIFLSQFLYDNKDKTGAQTHLNKAASYCPKSTLVTELQAYNKQGYSLFTYNKKQAEDDNRMN